MELKRFFYIAAALLLSVFLFAVFAGSPVQASDWAEAAPSEEEEEEEEFLGKPGSEDWDSEIPEAELKFNLYNGYAWITRVDRNFEDEDHDWMNPACEDACYDEDGQLLFTLPEGVRPASVFYDGYALVMEKDEHGNAFVSAVIDTDGEVVFTAEDIGADGFIFGIYENQDSEWDTYHREQSDNIFSDFTELRPVEDPFLEEGYLFAYTFEESYKGVEFCVGIVDMNGEWVVPLDKENIATGDGDYSPGAMLRGLSYCREGIWFRLHSGPQEWFYSLKTNDWQRYIGTGDDSDFIFSDGRAVAIGLVSGDVSYLYAPEAGNKLLEYEDIDIQRNKEYEDVYFYYHDSDAHIIYAYIGMNMIAFDDDLNELFRTELHEAYPIVESSNGYLPLVIRNNKGTKYWGILDPEGEFLFEPVQEEQSRCSRFVMDEDLAVFWIDGGQFSSDGCAVYDADGNQVVYIKPDDWNQISYHNGVLMLQKGSHGAETKYVLLR